MKYSETAKRLAEAISEKGLTPQELANRSGVSKSSISQYRNGTHKPSNISSGKMGKVLEVNPLWLMGYDVDKYDIENPFSITINKKHINLFEGVNKFASIATQERVNQLYDYINYLIIQQERENQDK